MSEKPRKKISQRRARTKPGELPQILKTKHGSAYMNYKGRRYFLGTYGSAEAEQNRRRIIAEYEAGLNISPRRTEGVTVAMLVSRFLAYAIVLPSLNAARLKFLFVMMPNPFENKKPAPAARMSR